MWQRGPQLGVWREADTALVPDIGEIQNKVICLWIETTCSVNVASTCSGDLYDISRRKPSRGTQFKIAQGPENENSPLGAAQWVVVLAEFHCIYIQMTFEANKFFT